MTGFSQEQHDREFVDACRRLVTTLTPEVLRHGLRGGVGDTFLLPGSPSREARLAGSLVLEEARQQALRLVEGDQ